MAASAAACLALGFLHFQSADPVRFACYLLAALLASALKVNLPSGTLSVNFLFTLLGVLEMGLVETLLLGLAGTLTQLYWRPARRLNVAQLVFNLSQVTVSGAAAYASYHLVCTYILHGTGPLALLAAALVHFCFNSLATSTIIGLTENKPVSKVWSDSYLWSFPYYMVGAAIAGLVSFLNRHIGWQSSLLVLPPIYLMYRSYRLYLGKLEADTHHAEQVSSIHLRTIEALALAIEAKDQTTGQHLQRVRVYAMELAKELHMSEEETEALRAAAVLHDIGKLAVPEHIISKPSKLTPEEFEKMKIHPVVGAEILEQVDFPYPVVPIVRAHHEKWDGTGYPDGLAGEAIPMGARILAAVDCLDALASDRQYRKALSLQDAMAMVAGEAGKAFDPRIVEILLRRYVEWERLARQQPRKALPKLSTDIQVKRGLAPAAGYAEWEEGRGAATEGNASRLAEARRQAQSLCELAADFRGALSLADILALLAGRLRQLAPHDAVAVFLRRGNILRPALVSGENARVLAALEIPLGEGLAGWVAQNHKPILNGNPAVEPGYLSTPAHYSSLRSALAVPLEGSSDAVAVLALYRAAEGAFHRDDLSVVEAMAAGLGVVIEEAARPRAVGTAAGAE